MPDLFVTVITSVLITFGIIYIWAKWKLSYWQRRGVPTLPTNVLFGNFTDSILLRISPGFLLGRLHNEAKPDWKFLGIYILHKPCLLLRDPNVIKQMFVKDFDIFSNRYFGIKEGKDEIRTRNLFTIDNPEWRYLRSKLSPAFSSGKVKALFGLMVESSESLENFLADQFMALPKASVSIDVKNAGSRFTTDIMSSFAFGIRTDSFQKITTEFHYRSRKIREFRNDLFSTFIVFCLFFFPRIAEFCSSSTFFGNEESYFRNIFWHSMKAREESNTDRADMMGSLLKLKNERAFQGDSLVAQSAIVFAAGLETTADIMAFALLELAKHPHLQEHLRREILERLKDGGMTYENVQQMKYLMQVINETLRLYPPAPIVDRVAAQDYKIPESDVIIEKGTPVYVALPGIHMDPDYFSNPCNFDPDRFAENNKILPYTFMPFGAGPHICIGMRIGIIQTAVGLIKVLRNYRISVDPLYKARISTRHIFLKPEDGIHLHFEKLGHH